MHTTTLYVPLHTIATFRTHVLGFFPFLLTLCLYSEDIRKRTQLIQKKETQAIIYKIIV